MGKIHSPGFSPIETKLVFVASGRYVRVPARLHVRVHADREVLSSLSVAGIRV